jgi:hypothetical protein
MSAISQSSATQTGVLDEPAVGLAGWKIVAPQTVIVSDRCNREPNDLNRRSLFSAPHPLSKILLQTKGLSKSTLGRLLRDAWVALAWPLGDPSVTQAQSQSSRQWVAIR